MKLLCAVAIYLVGCLLFSAAFGCVYTVRDVGFADVGSAPYRLYYYVRNDTSEELTSTFRQISYVALMDSNVEAAIINVDQREDNLGTEANAAYDQAMKYADFWNIQSFPAAVLTSPTGRSLVLPISVSDEPFRETIWSVLEGVVISPGRNEILSAAISTYCVIVLVQGNNATENERARKAVDDAVQELSKIMSQMPDSIEKPPEVMVMPPKSFSRERVLLWGLGVSEGVRQGSHIKPYVAVIYGRGRRIGPLLKGEEITAKEIFNILSIIGESCECGIDKRWLMGMMIPLRWGAKAQSEAVENLGFDVEDPMVKTEISQIMSKGIPAGTVGTDVPERGARGAGPPLEEYSETVVEFKPGQAQAAVSPAQLRQLVSPESIATDMRGQGVFRPYQTVLLIISGIALLVLAAGVFIMLRARRRVL
ncbi:hypothetical protein ACFL6S_16665 [Candidatus Poribacteria bacterium]